MHIALKLSCRTTGLEVEDLFNDTASENLDLVQDQAATTFEEL
jgi:hypothetical protein